MHLSRVDRAFERYRASGDPRPLARVFDATAPELFRLAWHLIGDRHAAEDLVQATFLVAIEDAGLFEPGNRVMPWLCGILANRARDARRRARVRSAVTAPVEAAVANPADAASGNELTGAVREQVRALSEPYRTVLILHLEHLLSGKEIADALHRPAATVRSQIQRGLELLRKALPVGFTAGLSSPTPSKSLDRVRAVVLAKASAAAPKSVGPLVGSTGGVLAVKKLAGIAIVLVLALVVAQLWMDGWDYESPNVPSPVSPTIAQVPEPEAVSTDRFDPPKRRPLVDAAPVDETGAIVVSVHWADNGAPAPDVAVRWWPKHGLAELFERMGRTDSDGHVRFGDLAPGPCVVAVDRGDRAAAEISAGATHRIEIAIPPGLELRGRVLDGEDRPIAQASVWLSNDSGSVDRGDIVAETGEDGSFVVRAVQPGRMVSAWAEGFQPARVIKIPDGEEGQPFEVTLRLHAAPGTLHGRVVDADGEPVENAVVLVGQADGARYIIADGKPMADPARFVRSDGSGWFHVTGVRPGRQLVWARAPGFAPWRETIEVAGYGTTSFEIRLLRGASVSGKIVDGHGDPAEMVWIRALHEEIEPGPRQAWQGPDWARVWTMTDSEGRFELSHLMPGRMKLRAQRDRDHVTAAFSLLDEQRVTWEAQIGTGLSIRGVVSDENAVPLSGWKVWAQPTPGQEGMPLLQTVRTDEAGRFDLTGAEAGSYELIVRFDESGMHPAEWTVYSVRPGPEIVQVTVPRGRIPSTRFAGCILSPDGEPLGDFRLSLIRIGEDGTLDGAGGADGIEDGCFESKPVLPGRYFLTVRAEEHGTLRLGTWEGGVSETVDIGEHGYSEPGVLGVEIVGSDGERIPHGRIVLCREGQPQGTLMSMDHGVGRIENLQPGRYLLSSWGSGVTSVSRHVEVAAGRATEVRFEVPDGVLVKLRYPPVARDNYALREVWRDASGDVVFEGGGSWDRREESFVWTRLMPAGQYTLEISDASGAARTIEVVASDPPSDAVYELPVLRR